MNKYRYFIFSFLLLSAISSFALPKTYYLSSSTGNNKNTGTDELHPWKTIERLNQQTLKPGNVVLFKCNDVFFGEMLINQSGTKSLPIVLASYGKGAKPIISGAIPLQNFTRFNQNIWQTNCSQNVKSFYNKGNLQSLARYPNSGFAIMQNGVNNSITFIDSALKQKPGYWENTNLRFRTWDWELRSSVVKKFDDFKVTLSDSSTNTLGKGWGYYFDNKFEELDSLGEWFYNPTKKTLYYYGGNNFKGNNTQAVVLNCGIKLHSGVSNVRVSNLNIQKFDVYGINLSGNNTNVTIANNSISQINHTGVFVNDVSKACKINNNQVFDINGRGIFALEPEQMLIDNNNVHHIGLIMGYGISGVNGMIGITVTNNEVEKTAQSHIATNNRITNNNVQNVGYVGIRMDGAYSLMQGNIVNNALLKLSDGAAIYCWAKSKYFTHDNQIKYNFVSNVSGSNYGTPSGPVAAANGIYVDNLIYNVSVAGNTVSNISANGIHINSDAYDNSISNNLVYNCKTGLAVAEWAKPGSTKNNSFFKNTVFINKPTYRGVILINWLLPSTKNMATFNNNTYYSLQSDTLSQDFYNLKDSLGNTLKDSFGKDIRIERSYTLNDWRTLYGYETEGTFTNLSALNAKGFKPQLITNTGLTVKKISFVNKKVYNLKGKIISSISLAPLQSTLVLNKN